MNGYSYLTLEQRREIERMYTEGERVVDIAARLKRSVTAIYAELKRGYTGEFDSYARQKYSADFAQRQRKKTSGAEETDVAQVSNGKGASEMLYFHSWSGGKDSTASVILDHIHELPPSKIIFSEVMFDKKRGISGELPEHIDFVMNKAKPLFESWGYTVEIVHAEKDYLDLFFHVLQRSKVEERIGKHVGWLLGGACAANRDLKIKPIRDYYKRLDLAGADR